MDDELEQRVDRLDRRQRYTLLLLVYPYLVGAVWLLTGTVEASVTPLVFAAVPAVVIVVGAYLRTLVRARAGGTEN